MKMYTHCRICKSKLIGRSDKQFCSQKCKSHYHRRLRAVTKNATRRIDNILHRNRSILLEIMGKNTSQKTISSHELDRRKFNMRYMTGFYENAQGKRYHVVYDFAWMAFSNGKILIIKRK